jgi:[glutamine synthetase] adenylyltransferase / [glutamine synthetase]-adenylyl-L-tyrosine phosphorylase
MVCASTWAADYLNRHPLLLDELLDPRLYEIATDWAGFRDSCGAIWPTTPATPSARWTSCAKCTTPRSSACWPRTWPACRPSSELSDHLTELADTIVQETLPLVWSKIKNRHRDTPKFAVIGYGKMGGKELGYASDLDLVYLYDDDDQDAQENYTRLGQRLNTWLSSQTSAGILFETDLRLRPNGDAGLLAVPSTPSATTS